MRHFCTLFDRAYLAKGLVLHESLVRHSSESFTLHILAMDTETLRLLQYLDLPNVDLMSLLTFERALNMEPVKVSRSRIEYYWTAASCLMEYLMPWMDEGGVTYLDADLWFTSDPKVIFDEIGERSLGIIPHRFPAHLKHKEVNGIYNVSLVTAKNTPAGKACITQWASNCRSWCFNRIEGEHACGDQKYLDRWEYEFPGEVAAIQNIGAGVAPWNITQYRITEGPKVDGIPVTFYHLHEFKDAQHLTNYALRPEDREYIYKPYVAAWEAASERIRQVEARHDEQMKQLELQAGRA